MSENILRKRVSNLFATAVRLCRKPGTLAFALALIFSSAHYAWSQQDLPGGTNPDSQVREIATNLTGFSIPFQINADYSAFIEVQLFVSRDLGQTWQFVGKQATDAKEFPFYADGDGEYWFALKTLSRDRRLLPEGNAQPELKIVVDTENPVLEATVETDAAGRVVCSWDARDRNIDPDSFRILYQTVSNGSPDPQPQWLQVPYQTTRTAGNGIFNDSIAWWPDTSHQSLDIRIEIADKAGNMVFETRKVNVPQVSWRRTGSGTAHAGDAINPRHTGMYPPSNYEESSYPPVRWNPDAQRDTPEMRSSQSTISGGLPQNLSARQPPSPYGAVQQYADKPDGIICEDGVCRRIGSDEQSVGLPPRDSATSAAVQQAATRPRIGSVPEEIAPPVPPSLLPTNRMQSNRVRQQQASPGEAAALPAAATPPEASVAENTGPSVPWESTTLRGPDPRAGSSGTTYQLPGGGFNESRSYESQAGADGSYQSNPVQRQQPDRQSGRQLAAPDGMFVNESTTARPRPGQDYFPQRNLTAGGSPSQPRSQTSGVTLPPNAQSAMPPNARAAMPQSPLRDTAGAQTRQASNRAAEPQSVMRPFHQPTDSDVIPVNSKRFRLNYSIDAIDPSGVERVDLWVTFDGGQTWKTWGTDPDAISPFPVEVAEPGLYAFRIVVHSRDGLTGRAPMRGDKPDMWINVDVDAPVVQIKSVPYGRGSEAGRLIINWEASDPHLTLRPVAIRYSVDLQGPWTTIETGLRNSGRYVWRPGPEVPERLYLRVEARDNAGNTGVFQLNQPLDVSGLVPRGTIQSVDPVGN